VEVNIVLVQPEIPPNTGNVARLCAATGATLHLVEPLGFRLDDKTLKRAGMDYWEEVTWQYHESLDSLKAKADPAATFYYASTKVKRPYTEPRYQWDDYLVFGRETAGLPEELLRANPETNITIPMWNPKARSLNLSTAVAVVLYEAMRQIKGL
jgi:tRNA (cytidine/uridine-2'-O-)-methyltransferase